jgi:hypothetical protein
MCMLGANKVPTREAIKHIGHDLQVCPGLLHFSLTGYLLQNWTSNGDYIELRFRMELDIN